MTLVENNPFDIDVQIMDQLTCMSSFETTFIVDKSKMKSQNQPYNKEVATVKHPKFQGFWSVRNAYITSKRNRQIRSSLNKSAKLFIDHCLEHNSKIEAFGWNTGVKQSINLSYQINQQFMQLLTARFKNHIKQLFKHCRMQFVESQQIQISQAPFLNIHSLSKYSQKNSFVHKQKRLKPMRIRTSADSVINAHAKNAANILTKLELQLGLNLVKPDRALSVVPPRLHVWETKVKKRRDFTEAAPVQTA